MSDIFADTQVPAWLQRIAQPADMSIAAKDTGMLIGGALNAAQLASQSQKQSDSAEQAGQNVPAKSWLQELPRGIFEARMNQFDPMWKVKMAQAGAQLQLREAQAQRAFNDAEVKAHNAQLETNDAPAFADWLKATQSDPNAPIPQFGSAKYNNMAKQIQIQQMGQKNKMDMAQLRADMQALQIQAGKDKVQETIDQRKAEQESRDKNAAAALAEKSKEAATKAGQAEKSLEEKQREFNTREERLKGLDESRKALNEARAAQLKNPPKTQEQKDLHTKANVLWNKYKTADANLQKAIGIAGESDNPQLMQAVDGYRNLRDSYGRAYNELLAQMKGQSPATPTQPATTNAPASRFKLLSVIPAAEPPSPANDYSP